MIFITISSLGLAVAGLRPNAFLISAGYFVMLFVIPLASGSSQAIFQVKVPLDLQGRVFAMRSMISRSIMPIAFLTAGPLADLVFMPILSEGGVLANTFIAQVVGVGPGRGIGLIFILAGLGTILITWLAYSNPKIRHIETSIPDVIKDQEPEDDKKPQVTNLVPIAD